MTVKNAQITPYLAIRIFGPMSTKEVARLCKQTVHQVREELLRLSVHGVAYCPQPGQWDCTWTVRRMPFKKVHEIVSVEKPP